MTKRQSSGTCQAIKILIIFYISNPDALRFSDR